MSSWISEQDKRTFPSESLATILEADRFWLSLYAPSKLILMNSHLYSFVSISPYGPKCITEKLTLTRVELR
ncbi:hypothetical protein V6Z12_D01G141700 [Gossypium hirsutum]